jgi:hypothetical protein
LSSQDVLQGSRHNEVPRSSVASGKPDPISGLKAPTVFGRPNWNKIFDDLIEECVAVQLHV